MPTNNALTNAAHVAFIVSCVALTAAVAYRVAESPSRSSEGAIPVTAGRTLPKAATILDVEHDVTVVVAVSPSCSYCSSSAAFYRRLLARRDEATRRVRIMLASREPVGQLARFAAEHGLGHAELTQLPADFPLTGTPMLWVVDRRGTILAGWFGQLTPAQEDGVLRLVS